MADANLLALIERAEGKRLTSKQRSNARSIADALEVHGARVGLGQPHRLAQFLAQVSHESGSFRYDREVWGPTPAQARYDTRTDIGNTSAKDGDGFLFRGHTGIQITGRANTRAFRDWCRKLMAGTGIEVPDFERQPEKMLTDPWEGLGPIWYWDSRGLNRYADNGDAEMITKRINGGFNGYADRLDRLARYSLALLGYDPKDVSGFQKAAGIHVDGIAGPRTRAALHELLVAMTDPVFRSEDVQAGPVVEETTVEKPVVPEKVEKEVRQTTNWGAWLTSLLGAITGFGAWVKDADPQLVIVLIGAGAVMAGMFLFGGEWIVRRVKRIRKEIEAA